MKNSGVVAAIAVILFAVALAVSIGSRLSEQTMTMLTGAACGAGLSAPLAILAGMVIGGQRASRDRQPPQQPHAPIVVMTPPQQAAPSAPVLPVWSSLQPAAPGMAIPAPRHYTILGEETIIDGNDHFRQS